jgi:hypothetical protein
MDVYASGFRSGGKAGFYNGMAEGLADAGGNAFLINHFARKADGRKIRKMADAEDQYLAVLFEDVVNPAMEDPDVFNVSNDFGGSSDSGSSGYSDDGSYGNGGNLVDLPGGTQSLDTPVMPQSPAGSKEADERVRLEEASRKEAEEKARKEAEERARKEAEAKRKAEGAARRKAEEVRKRRSIPVLRQLAFVTREELTNGARKTFEVEGTSDSVTVDVAPGSREGARVIVPGHGGIDRETGRRGDLELQLVVASAPHHHHHAGDGRRAPGAQAAPDVRRGHIGSSDMGVLSVRHQVLLVTREELQNGARKRIEVDETHERISVDIAPGSRSGMRIRVPGYGCEDRSTGNRGDLELQLVEM